MVEDVMTPTEVISIHIQAAGIALKRKDKKTLVKQLMMALEAAENEEL
jgi:hypothetical protein